MSGPARSDIRQRQRIDDDRAILRPGSFAPLPRGTASSRRRARCRLSWAAERLDRHDPMARHRRRAHAKPLDDTVAGGGSNIAGTSDSSILCNRRSAATSASPRRRELQGSNSSAKRGVMFRAQQRSNSAAVCFALRPGASATDARSWRYRRHHRRQLFDDERRRPRVYPILGAAHAHRRGAFRGTSPDGCDLDDHQLVCARASNCR